MTASAAATVEQYLAELPPDRRSVLAKVRDVIRRHLPKGYREEMGWGMISYTLPLDLYAETYNGQPLCYAALAAQKSHCAVYLTGAYADPKVEKAIRDGFAKAGKKLDIGKSCIRFRTDDDLPLEVIGWAVASMPPDRFIAQYESARGKSAAARKTSAKKAAARKSPAPARKKPAARKKKSLNPRPR